MVRFPPNNIFMCRIEVRGTAQPVRALLILQAMPGNRAHILSNPRNPGIRQQDAMQVQPPDLTNPPSTAIAWPVTMATLPASRLLTLESSPD
jgi:hypothetical protein